MPKPADPLPSPPAAAPAAAMGGGKPNWAKGTLVGVGGDASAGGAGPIQAPALGPPMLDEEDDEVQTTIAPVPQELLAEAAYSNEQIHFRDVYEKFIATKEECGEPTAGLTFEKFEKTLHKNRDAIVSRHGAKSVRFTVYVKEGKAALKATPIKG